MTITIETSGIQETEQLLKVLKSLNISNVKIHAPLVAPPPTITKGNKKLDPTQLFGIWKDHPKTIEEIRSSAWKRNWETGC